LFSESVPLNIVIPKIYAKALLLFIEIHKQSILLIRKIYAIKLIM